MIFIGNTPQLKNRKRLSESFYIRLKKYDPDLDALFDWDSGTHGSVFIWAKRKGQMIHELTIEREFGECFPELEGRILNVKLPACDVWRRFGRGVKGAEAYDDHLHAEETKFHAQEKKRKHEENVGKLLDTSGDKVLNLCKELKHEGIMK